MAHSDPTFLHFMFFWMNIFVSLKFDVRQKLLRQVRLRRQRRVKYVQRQRHAYFLRERSKRRRFFIIFALYTCSNSLSVPRNVWKYHRVNDLWEEAMNSWNYIRWMENMRMSRVTFHYITEKLEPCLLKEDTNMRKCIPVSKRIMICLYKLATNLEFRTIGNLFGIGRSTACQIFHEVCEAIQFVLTPMFITFPRGEQLQQVVDGFLEDWNYPQCAG